ncbi:DoxX family protein [Chania multitudinisentens]|uniref:DoxX family protein n=1 Tax=Chania multitudinisentens TaxID=1639108 RepID=UPI0003E14835|nr:DoxX family protein [Chania multitudinisentens]
MHLKIMHYLISHQKSKTIPLFLFRISIGAFFFSSGFGKLFIPKNQMVMLETMIHAGIPYPNIMAVVVAGLETFGGFLLILGFFSRFFSLILFTISLTALLTVGLGQIPPGLNFLGWYSWLFYLPETLYMLILASLMIEGGGKFSLDSIISNKLSQPISATTPLKSEQPENC